MTLNPDPSVIEMQKLIERYLASPTPRNREALQAYIKRHPMAVVTCSEEQINFLRSYNFSF